jgi:hypothetical protein
MQIELGSLPTQAMLNRMATLLWKAWQLGFETDDALLCLTHDEQTIMLVNEVEIIVIFMRLTDEKVLSCVHNGSLDRFVDITHINDYRRVLDAIKDRV